MNAKEILLRFPFLYNPISSLRHRIRVAKSLRKTSIHNQGSGKVILDVIGTGNTIRIDQGTRMSDLTIRIRGNNNTLHIGRRCNFGPDCSIWMEGSGAKITIGDECTFTMICHLNAQENNSVIELGNDCMFSNHIIVRTSDSHPIYDCMTQERLNAARPVRIGSHVWIAPNTKIMKGAEIADNCIIGSDSTVSKPFIESNSLIAGRPAIVVRRNVRWSRERLF